MESAKAIRFIEVTPEGEFKLTDDAMNVLQEIGDKKVAPIFVSGPWRTGKSFLANRILGQMKGFQIGSTVKACTKGIWMWNQPIKLANKDGYALVFDAEGLNSTERSTGTDIKIFALSLLLSSLFIYNQKGHITESTLEELSIVANLTKLIHVKKTDSEAGNDFYKYFPELCWVLRDFTLDLQKKSPREYLEESLKQQPSVSEEGMKKNAIRQAIVGFFRERDCIPLARPVNEEAKIAHLDEMKYDQLKPDFTKPCDAFVHKILSKVEIKEVNGVPLTASMLLGLALEYIQSINDQETPTITTALERVVLDESRRHAEKVFEDFTLKINDKLPESALPIEEDEVNQIAEQLKAEAFADLVKELRDLCSASDLIDNLVKFEERIKLEVARISKINMSSSEELCSQLLQRLTERIELPKIHSTTDIKPTLMIEFTEEWTKLFDEYKKLAKGPAKNSVLLDFTKTKVLTSTGELLKDVLEVYTDSENKLKIFLTELQASEKKWKTLVDNNEKILAERNIEKDELMSKSSELDLRLDQLQRELKNKENEMKSNKNLQAIEIANLKHLHETMLNEKILEIKDLNNKAEAMAARVEEVEKENQALQNENIRHLAKLKNPILIDSSSKDVKKEPKATQQQLLISSLYKNIKASFEEFKDLLGDVTETSKLKKQISELQRELSDKEFTANKKMLDIRKEMGNQITEVKLKHENEIRNFNQELDGLKQNNRNLSEKLLQAENKNKLLNTKLEAIRVEKTLVDENLKIKEELVVQYQTLLDQETHKLDSEKSLKQDVEMELSRIKVEWALISEDIEALIDFIIELGEKYAKKKLATKEVFAKMRGDKVKTMFVDLLSQSGFTFDKPS